jgi:serine/threonine protein kinase
MRIYRQAGAIELTVAHSRRCSKGRARSSMTSFSDYLDLVRKSSVVDDKVLDSYVEKLRENGPLPATASELSTVMVRDGILTKFQARQLLQGKWRRFVLGKYKILERLGSGGMGLVYLCEHKLMRRRVAVKVLPTSRSKDPSALERFYREARAVAALDHPNIVRAYDIDQDGDVHFLVMEYIEGASLQEVVKSHEPLPVATAANYIYQAALGLQHAFQRAGLIHRDIKPDNILVDRRGVVKVLDMGLARFFHDDTDLLTQVYDEKVLGTIDYLAPEQVIDSPNVDIRADIYSLGATFYFCLTGQTLFGQAGIALKRIWHQVRQPKPVRTVRPEVPEELAEVLTKMIAKNPAHRYQTPQEVADALSRWGKPGPVAPAAASGPPEH